MATIVTRAGKGSPLTNAEVDANFTNLNTELAGKALTSSLALVATTGAYSSLTGRPTAVSAFTNDAGYLTGITSGQVTTALGFAPYNATNPAGYISGITSGMVTTALGFTPYNASNPAGYITSFTETDPTVPSHVKSITTTNIANWNAAHSWGNHAAAGYLTGITSGQVTTALGYTPVNRAGDTMTGSLTIRGAGTSTAASPATGTEVLGFVGGASPGSYGASVNFTQQWWTGAPNDLVSVGQIAGLKLAGNGNFGGGLSFFVVPDGLTTMAESLRLDSASNAISYGSVRAPIFFDSNNTGYYLDPAGGSILGSTTLQSTSDAQLFLNGNGSSWAGIAWTDVSATDYMFYNGSTSTFAIGGGGSVVANKKLHINGSVTIGSGLAATSAGTNSLVVEGSVGVGSGGLYQPGSIYSDGNWGMIFRARQASPNTAEFLWTNAADGTMMRINAGGSVVASGDFRAPIFYDSNDTGYYVDPNSTSQLQNLTNYGTLLVASTGAFFIQASNGGYQRADSRNDSATLSRTHWYGVSNTGGTSNFRHAWYDNAAYFNITAQDGEILFERTAGETIVRSAGSFRSPIFYDSNNTAFFVDPASQSNLFDLIISGTGNKYLQISAPTGNEAMVRYIGATGSSWYVGKRTAAQLVGTADFHFFAENPGATVAGIDTAGNIFASGSVRAPIFYDTQNTGFYVDPNSVTNINRITASGRSLVGSATIDMSGLDQNTYYPVTIPLPVARRTTLRIENALNSNAPSWSTHPAGFSCYVEWVSNGFGWGTINVDRYIVNWREGFANASIVGGFAQMGHSSQEVIWLRGGGTYYFSADCDVTPTIRTTTYESLGQTVEPRSTPLNNPYEAASGRAAFGEVSTTFRVSSSGDMRAPIFLDSNDTSYYLDPNGVSVLNAINVWGEIGPRRSDTQSLLRSYNTSAGSPLQFYLDHNFGNVNIGNSRGVVFAGGSYWEIANSVRSPIFYDSENTGYYVNPNGASALSGALLIGPTSGGAYTRFGAGAGDTAHSTISASNGNLHIDSQAGYDLYLNWYTARPVWSEGGAYFPIYYDRNNSAYYVDPAGSTSLRTVGDWRSDSSAWTGEFAGKIQYHASNWYFQAAGAWEFRRSDTVNAFSVTQGGTAIASADMRAPIFYDNNDTSYYVDPNNVSILNNTLANRFTNRLDVSADINFGLYFSNNQSSAYAIYREGGVWDWPFPDLRIAFHTGIKIGANASYQGVRFYTDYDMVTQVMSVNNGSDGIGAGHVFINNSLQVNGDVRTPIFYDVNNTAFYLDPNSTGTSLNVAGAIVAAGNVTAFSDIRVKDNVEQIEGALDRVSRIRGVTYTRTDLDDKERRYGGVIAQEIEAVLPEAIFESGDKKAVDYNATIGLLIEAIKELNTEVNHLKQRIH
jgi:hypothetical protein